jgi:hypothetical protein
MNTITDTAHNIFLDIFASTGFLGISLYLAIIFYIFSKSLLYVKKSAQFDPIFVLLFSCWLAYQAQAVISINQIGIGLWGWVLSGLIIGYEISGRRVGNDTRMNNSLRFRILLPTTGLIIGLFIGIPNYVYGVKFSSAFKTLDAAKILKASTSKPYNQYPMWIASYQLLKSNLPKESLIVAQKLTNEFPNSYDGWRIIHSNPTASNELKATALEQMKRLDPLNKNLNLQLHHWKFDECFCHHNGHH